VTSNSDDIDDACTRWATLTRRRCGIESPPKQTDVDAVATLQAALVTLETATGGSILGPVATLQDVFDRMPRELSRLVQLHYLLPSIPARVKAKFFDVSPPAYYAKLDTGVAYLRGYFGAARLEMEGATR
jgi:hypothetical protein